jgi:hypothetical protein
LYDGITFYALPSFFYLRLSFAQPFMLRNQLQMLSFHCHMVLLHEDIIRYSVAVLLFQVRIPF